MKPAISAAFDPTHSLFGWQRQNAVPAPLVERAEHIYFWDVEGKRYADFCSGQMNVNVGYGHPHILAAMRRQMETLTYIAPNFPTEARLRLATMVTECAPPGLNHVFFSNSGAEAVETAIKIARAVTGRTRIYSGWQSYHGATAGAAAVSGDPRRHYVEPAMPGIGKFLYPNCYRCPFGQSAPPGCHFACLASLRSQIVLDGPETVAAILLEPIVGTSGLYVPPPEFISGVRALCDEFGILLIFDETMTGWGRTGKWFASEHFAVVPDIITTAKGLASGYVPLSATIVNQRIRDHFAERPLVAGVTTEAHTLACAAAIANIEVYRNEGLIERSATEGAYLHERLAAMKERHPCIGDVRGKGLFACIELTADRAAKKPLAGYRNSQCDVATDFSRRLLAMGIFLVAKWDFIFLAPPLVITRCELDEHLDLIDSALNSLDELV
jgi:taurine--2-oxoglutarate transaminase